MHGESLKLIHKILNTQDCSHITKDDPYFLDTIIFKAANA